MKNQWKELKEYVKNLYNETNDDIPRSCYEDILIKISEIEKRPSRLSQFTEDDIKVMNALTKKSRGIKLTEEEEKLLD